MGDKLLADIFEVNIKSNQDLESTIKSLKVLNASRVMLTDRDPSRPQLAYARAILAQLPGIEVSCVYSPGSRVVEDEEDRGGENSWQSLLGYISSAGRIGVKEVLIVSGQPKREGLDSVAALQYLKEQAYIPGRSESELPKLSVAYNPYLPTREIEVENQRLKKKQASGLISCVYFQLGEDAGALAKGIEQVKSLVEAKIYAAILTPSVETITRLKANPWPGVIYQDFYSSVETAINLNSKIEFICKRAGVGIYLCGAV